MDREHLITRYGGEFINALEVTLEFEGGWADHPNDRGGLTYMGITRDTYYHYMNVIGGDLVPFWELTPEVVADIYYQLFWYRTKIGSLPWMIADFVFDFYVHSGPRAVKFLQREIGVKVDGQIGPNTIAASKRRYGGDYVALSRGLAKRRMRFLCRIVRRDPSQAAFIVGWFNRVSTWL